MSDILDADWARAAVERINRGAEAWNSLHRDVPAQDRLRVVWGYHSRHDEEAHLHRPRGPCQEGLLSYFGLDVELFVVPAPDPALPAICNLSTFLGIWFRPRRPRDLLNVLDLCERNVQVNLARDRGGVVVLGTHTSLLVEAITGRTLEFALSNLADTHENIEEHFGGDEGDDEEPE